MSQLAKLGTTLLSPFTSGASWYNRTAQAHPFTTGCLTTGLKTSAADLFAQKVIEKRENIDWTRHAVFCTFGFAYLGAFQYWLYNVKFTQWCAPLTARFGHKMVAPLKVFIDQGIHHPFLYFPTFFAMKATVSGQPLSTAVDKYRTEIVDSVKALWSVWVPLQFINFAFVPRHLRIPYVAAVSFGWTVILSVMQGKFDAAKAMPLKLAVAEAHQQQAVKNHEIMKSQPGAPAAAGMSSSVATTAAAASKGAVGSLMASLKPTAANSALEVARGMPRGPIVTMALAEEGKRNGS